MDSIAALPLVALRVFEAAARHESFTRAAGELAMTQAAVSYQIKSLEERTGLRLFLRANRRVRLTPEGKQLAVRVGEGLALIRSAYSESCVRARGRIVLSLHHGFAMAWLAARLTDFQSRHPELSLRVEASNAAPEEGASTFDAAIRRGTGEWPGFQCRKLFYDSFTPVCSPAFLKRHGKPRTPAAIAKMPLLGVTDPWWELWFHAAGVMDAFDTSRADIRFSTQHLDVSAAMGGEVVAIVSPLLFRQELDDRKLVRLSDLVVSDPYPYWLVLPPPRFVAPAAWSFQRWLDDVMRGEGLLQ